MNTLTCLVLSMALALTAVFQPPAPTPAPPARAATPLPADRVFNDWIISPLNGHQYKLVDCHFWQECEDQAVSQNAHLVTINDLEENSWLVSTYATQEMVWIGFTDAAVEGVWRWASGDTSSFTHWGPMEPNNAGGCENYAVLYIRAHRSGDWNDAGYCVGSADFPGVFERSNIGPVLPGSENWLGGATLPGVNGTVYSSIVTQEGDLIIGGSFNTVGGAPQRNIARWDGESWYAVGSGLSGTVSALAADDEGTIYAASVAASGSSGAVYLLQNDRWTQAGESSNGAVSALAVDQNGYLYAGGAFTRIGNVDAQHVARWNGARWQSLAQGVDGPVYALVVDSHNTLVAGGQNILWVGGKFSSAGDKVAANLARWIGPDRQCDLTSGVYRFYETFLPVTITVVEPGTLSCLDVQLFNRSHWSAQSAQDTGVFWQIVPTDSAGEPAGDYTVDLTLPSAAPADANDTLCRHTGFAMTWECDADEFDPAQSTVTRRAVTELMLHWAIGDGDLGSYLIPRMYFPLAPHD